jgi:hypothetical protein
MRFRTGIVAGAAFGYVLGAKAGRGRYEQIKSLAGKARRHPAVAQLASQTIGLIDAGRYGLAASLSAGSKGLRSLEDHAESG